LCSLAEVLGFQPAEINTVIHGPASRYNQAGGLGVAYGTNALLFDMGPNPVVRTYKIVNGKLRAESLIPYVPALDTDSDGDSDAEVANGIVHMKALYGKDTDGDRVVDTWNTTLPVTAAEWLQVRAIRVALLARSGQWEKNPVYAPAGCVGAACAPAAPNWRQDDGTVVYFTMPAPADGTDWRNYRYTTYQTTIPLRNMIWSTD
jgi:type IV pilus assembly protein PilW